MKRAIYTNGKSNFTLESYAENVTPKELNGIRIIGYFSKIEIRAMHSNGRIHYIHGCGDFGLLLGKKLNRHMKIENFTIY